MIEILGLGEQLFTKLFFILGISLVLILLLWDISYLKANYNKLMSSDKQINIAELARWGRNGLFCAEHLLLARGLSVLFPCFPILSLIKPPYLVQCWSAKHFPKLISCFVVHQIWRLLYPLSQLEIFIVMNEITLLKAWPKIYLCCNPR